MLVRTIRGGRFNLEQLGAIARATAPKILEHYRRERRHPIMKAPHRPDTRQWPEAGLHAAWLGHSTVLLKIDGVTVLTDPVFSPRVGLNVGPLTIGIRRLVAPALSVYEVPRPDLILLSHAHMDHFDLPSLRRLESRNTSIVTAAKTSDLIRVRRFGPVRELAWGQKAQVGSVCVRAFEVNHWGARVRSDVYRGYNGYLIETANYRILFGGDTALTDAFRRMRSSKKIDLAIMPIGAYDPWIRAHCTPEQALRMADDAGAEIILPVHHQTFRLGREGYYEPIHRLSAALRGGRQRMALEAIGQEFHLN